MFTSLISSAKITHILDVSVLLFLRSLWHLLCLLPILIIPSTSFTASRDYQIEIIKSLQELVIKKKDFVVKKFKVSYGRGAKGGKRRFGDNKTPTGRYKIMKFKSNSKFHYFMLIDYPNLLDAWHGYREQLITSAEFKQIATAYKNKQMPPQNTALGGYIGIHGIGKLNNSKLNIHRYFNWTEGCIALTNKEINELQKYVSIGTSVTIKE